MTQGQTRTKYSSRAKRVPAAIETKRHLDGRVERFLCRRILRRRELLVVRFDHTTARRAGGITIPRGGRTYGFFWPRRPYVLYRIVDARARLLAHRFDVVEYVRIDDAGVSYTDLLLDVWVRPGQPPVVEDADEVASYTRRRLLSTAQRRRIESTRQLLLRRHRAIVSEAERLIAGLGG